MYQPSMAGMPDVAAQKVVHQHQEIGWVGMGNLRLPLHLAEQGIDQQVVTNCEVFVNLTAGAARGIHMSRLYLLSETLKHCNRASLGELLGQFVETHHELSDAARIRLSFDLMLSRPALVSNNSGWRAYPIELEATLRRYNQQTQAVIDYHMGVTIEYSSTCPCSKALAEQVIVNKFARDMGQGETLSRALVQNWLERNAIYASPHSQRSLAKVETRLNEGGDWGIVELIDLLESKLKTAVQSAVKREDEQHFAVLNGQNPMFCEDAARILKNAMIGAGKYPSFVLRVDHLESLHAHNAVAICAYP